MEGPEEGSAGRVVAVRHLKSLRFLVYLAVFGVGLALLERHQSETNAHLSPPADPRVKPTLQGESLRNLGAVLMQLYPEDAESIMVMGKALAEQGKLVEAKAYLEKSLEIDRYKQELLFLYARVLLDIDESPEKIRAIVEEMGREFPTTRETVSYTHLTLPQKA